MAAAAVGSYAALFTSFLPSMSPLLLALASLGCMLYLRSSRGQGDSTERKGFLAAFGLFTGVASAPLLGQVAMVDPAIPLQAFVATTAVFACFSLAALRSRDRSFLYLAGKLQKEATRGA
jgi:FtsH-binding integral membrane protein